MKIDAVVIQPSSELIQALLRYSGVDSACNDAHEAVMTDHEGKPFLHIEPEMAEDWCRDWFGDHFAISQKRSNYTLYPDLPVCCEDPVIKEFVNAVLGIYRLCQTV